MLYANLVLGCGVVTLTQALKTDVANILPLETADKVQETADKVADAVESLKLHEMDDVDDIWDTLAHTETDVPCIGDRETFDTGFGGCDTYHPFGINFEICQYDFNAEGQLAMYVCEECGFCITDPNKSYGVCIGDRFTFNAGMGGCDSYGPSESYELAENHLFCSSDRDQITGDLAVDVCPECGECVATVPLVTTAPTTAPTEADFLCVGNPNAFDAGFGGCEYYAVDQRHHQFCSSDRDQITGYLAVDVCPQCGECVDAVPFAP